MNDKGSSHINNLLEGLYGMLKNNGETPLMEQAASKKQLGLMGAAYAAKKGDKPGSPKIVNIAKSMSSKSLKDFASTKQKGLPDKVAECSCDKMTDEELEIFNRHKVGKRGGRGQTSNPWNNLKKSGRGFKSRMHKEDADVEECAGVGTITKQNSTVDVDKNTPSKNLAAFKLEEALQDMYNALTSKIDLTEADTNASTTDMPVDHVSSLKGRISMPGLSQNKSNGNAYLQYRMGIAMAGAPDFPTKAAGAVAGDPLLSTYTDAELEIVNFAAKQVGAGEMVRLGANRSEEVPGVHTISPIAQITKNRYGI